MSNKWTEYTIVAQDPEADSEQYAVIRLPDIEDGAVLCVLAETDPTLEGDILVGGWDDAGNPTTAVDTALFEKVVPLGNHSDGSATKALRFGHFAGWGQVLAGDPASLDTMSRLYPGVPPFDLEIRSKFFETPATPVSTGYGFRAEMRGDPDTRDPAQYSTGAYTDDTYTTWLWPTVGAFQRGPSEWQVDDEGQPLEVWFQESWDGYRPDERPVWYVAVLHGPTIEGHAILPLDEAGVRYQFWNRTQGGGSGSEWVDTGATVIAQAGTVYRISDIEVAAALVPGQTIRFGDGAETTFTGTWAGGADYLEIDPFVQAAVGDAVWSFE